MQPAATFPSVLIAQYTDVALMIPAQPVRAEPSIMAVVDGSKRPLAHHSRPDQSIHLLDRLDLGLDNAHSFKDIRLPRETSMRSIIYNTVILVLPPALPKGTASADCRLLNFAGSLR